MNSRVMLFCASTVEPQDLGSNIPAQCGPIMIPKAVPRTTSPIYICRTDMFHPHEQNGSPYLFLDKKRNHTELKEDRVKARKRISSASTDQDDEAAQGKIPKTYGSDLQ